MAIMRVQTTRAETQKQQGRPARKSWPIAPQAVPCSKRTGDGKSGQSAPNAHRINRAEESERRLCRFGSLAFRFGLDEIKKLLMRVDTHLLVDTVDVAFHSRSR